MSGPFHQTHSTVVSVQVGPIAPLGPADRQVPSAFVKSTVFGPVRVESLGLAGDSQADLAVHGGPDKAVYGYPSEHYPRWIDEAPRHEAMFVYGAFGENLTTQGLTEEAVSIGDVFRIGSAEVQVTQPRQPCFKLGLRFNDNSLGRAMIQTGRTGWYARVLKPGVLQSGDEMQILRKPNPGWTIERFNGFIQSRRDDQRDLAELAELEGLAQVWKRAVIKARGHSSDV